MSSKRRVNPRRVLGTILVVLLLVGLAYFGVVYFRVDKVEIHGNNLIDNATLTKLVDLQPGQHMLLVSTKTIEKNLERNPMVEVTEIKKVLPSTIVVNMRERTPCASIAYGTQYVQVDDKSIVLAPPTGAASGAFPVFKGMEPKAASEGQVIELQNPYKMIVFEDVSGALESNGLLSEITMVDLTDANNIRMQSKMGVDIKFGQSDKAADKAAWIAGMLPMLQSEGKTAGTLDVSTGTSATFKPAGGVAPPQQTTQDPAQPSEEPTEQPSQTPTEEPTQEPPEPGAEP